MKILVIDNNDSFTRNLEHLLVSSCRAEVVIVPYGEMKEMRPEECDMIVISPGPGCPADYPRYEGVLDSGVPILGICLGMQIINEFFGGKTERLEGCVHGKMDRIEWLGTSVEVARYHSLHASEVGAGLEVQARNSLGTVMAIAHPERKMLGYQFHPESFMTDNGAQFIRHALDLFNLA